jgi:DNA-binding MarR family transcriptional regulator
MYKPIGDPNGIKIGPLLMSISRMHHIRADQFLEQVGIYRGQGILLLILTEEDGLTHSEVAKRMEISPAAATRVIQRMEALNYVHREPDPNDERVSRVFINEEGRAVHQAIREAFDKIDQIMLHNLTSEEQNSLTELLLKIYNNLYDQPSE